MKQFQKRYIYSALLASGFFLFIMLLFAILKINIVISIILAIILTILMYIGGIMLFKTKDVRDLTSDNINNYYFLASKVQSEASKTGNENIIKNVEEIGKLTDSIIVSLTQRPKKVESTFDFFDYYFDISSKILYKYNSINNKEELDKKGKDYLKDAEKYIETIKESFIKQSKNMQEAKILDIDTEIKIFEKTSGISKENIKVGDKHE